MNAKQELVTHLKVHSLRTDGPFSLSSGRTSSWYLDGRQTTYDGDGARIVANAVLEVLDTDASAVGGMTMGADPIAVATAVCSLRPLRSFSIRKQVKEHGTGGRLVGPVFAGDSVAVVEDTTTTGRSIVAAIDALNEEGIDVVQAIAVVDRSAGAAGTQLHERGIPFVGIVGPADLGVTDD